jgi:hypothetical protein
MILYLYHQDLMIQVKRILTYMNCVTKQLKYIHVLEDNTRIYLNEYKIEISDVKFMFLRNGESLIKI